MTDKRTNLYVICGAAGSGKSTLVSSVLKRFDGQFSLYKKFSERDLRGPDDDIRHRKEIQIGEFDLAYEAMGKKYAISFEEIRSALAAGFNVIMPTTDFRAVERLRHFFPDQCVTICVMSTVDSAKFEKIHRARYGFQPTQVQQEKFSERFEQLVSSANLDRWTHVFEHSLRISELVSSAIPEAESLNIRKTKIQNFQTRFFERPGIFDKVILNYRDGRSEDMLHQFAKVFRSPDSARLTEVDGGSKLFVISAASGHGKGKLAEALRIIAPNEIGVVPKQGKRDGKPNDKQDGLEAIGIDGEFCSENTFIFTSHKTDKFEGTPYAFNPKRIEENLQRGVSQVLVANSLLNKELCNRLRRRFGRKMVHIFLWRFQNEDELYDFQTENCATLEEAEARISQTNDIYLSYLDSILDVDFLLLNTSFYEDLHNQVFNLLSHFDLYH